jgi:hypothetical protein
MVAYFPLHGIQISGSSTTSGECSIHQGSGHRVSPRFVTSAHPETDRQIEKANDTKGTQGCFSLALQ